MLALSYCVLQIPVSKSLYIVWIMDMMLKSHATGLKPQIFQPNPPMQRTVEFATLDTPVALPLYHAVESIVVTCVISQATQTFTGTGQ